MDTKQCPWCAEAIAAEARKCRYCGSRLDRPGAHPAGWHRSYPDRKIAGVCAAVAENLDLPVTAVRVSFLLLVLFRGFGLFLYGVLWLLLPREPDGPSDLDRGLAWVRGLFEGGRGPGRNEDESRSDSDWR